MSKAMRNKWIDKKLSKRTKHGDKNIIHYFISFEPLHKYRYINICCINKIWLSVWYKETLRCVINMQVAQFSLLTSLLFVNISKTFLCLHHVETTKIEIKGVSKSKIVYRLVWSNKEICTWHLIVFKYTCTCI